MSYLFLSPRCSRLYSFHTLTYRYLHCFKQPKKKVFFQQYYLRSKLLCSSKIEDSCDQISGIQKYSEIYRFPAIRIGFVLHKLKWLQTMLTGAGIPLSALLYLGDIINYEWFIGTIASCFTVTFNLYVYAQLFHKAIGFMYVSEDESMVKISYLDFWGNRIDDEVPVNDIVPFCDAPRSLTDILYKEVVFYSDNKNIKPKLFMKKGQITDKDKFLKIFGHD